MTMIDPPPPHPEDRSWLKHTPIDKRPPIRIGASSGNRDDATHSVTFTELTQDERDAVIGFVNGAQYLRVIKGRLHAYDVYQPLPEAERDPLVGDRDPTEGKLVVLGDLEKENCMHFGLVLQGLLGDKPQRDAELLTEWGFVCMRSPRDRTGQYWELWSLFGTWMAGGALRQAIDEHAKQYKLDTTAERARQEATVAMKFLASKIRFGSLEVSVQRYAMCYDED